MSTTKLNLADPWSLDDFVATQKADDVFGKRRPSRSSLGNNSTRADTVIFVLPVRFNAVSSAHTSSLDESRFCRNRVSFLCPS